MLDIQRTAGLVSEISAACREPSVGIEQITQAVQQFDQVTRANAGVADEMNAAAEALSSEARLFSERTGFFQLKARANASTDTKPASAQAPNVVRMPTDASPGRSHPSQPARSAAGIDLSLDGESGFERISAGSLGSRASRPRHSSTPPAFVPTGLPFPR
ncbi:hypothetical protein [Aureimonas sp. D3]|uniref:hypothetical protein n=1 Tax=Aureimonas sp. D3 TaxID=1638164 RepID=UPI00078396F4|nr:hypothetical protein [Aureimonas sp. D3]